MTFSVRLEQVERRFPGLFNLRIAAVDVTPVAIMDPTRFSLALTHLGTGQLRLKAEPDTPPGTPSPSPLNTNDLAIEGDDWLRSLREEWPVKVRVTGPETAIFSGLTRQELVGLPAAFTANQRGAFEGLGAAGAWQVDMSMKENHVVPGTLADLLITFTLAGYYDASLRQAIDSAPRKATASTGWFSARQRFPDAFYNFSRSGRMDWDVTAPSLTLSGAVGAARNVAVLLLPTVQRPAFGRLACSHSVEFVVKENGRIEILSVPPVVNVSLNGLSVTVRMQGEAGTTTDRQLTVGPLSLLP